MYTQQESESMDDKVANSGIRNIRMAAVINDYLQRISGSEIIVTGGLSIEFYTRGGTTLKILTSSPRLKKNWRRFWKI